MLRNWSCWRQQAELDLELVYAGELTPVCFFLVCDDHPGVRPFLMPSLSWPRSPCPARAVPVKLRPFAQVSAVCVQAPGQHGSRHRDRVAFVRVCSGKFEKDMAVQHARTGKPFVYSGLRNCLARIVKWWKTPTPAM